MKRNILLLLFIFSTALSCKYGFHTMMEESDVFYRLTYDGNENTSGDVPIDNTQYRSGHYVTAAGNDHGLARTGYVFSGWNTAADGSGTTYSPGQTFIMGAADRTLYARWTNSNTSKVTYDPNGGTDSVPVDNTNYTAGMTVVIRQNTGPVVKAGSTFIGWSTEADAGTLYTSPQTFVMGTANVTLYARWTTNPTYTITYNTNTADSGSLPAIQASYEAGQTVTVYQNTGNLAKTGYTFTGWNTQANGMGTTYTASSTFSMPATNLTLYAKWTVGIYGINYDLNGGTGIISSGMYNYGDTVIIESVTYPAVKGPVVPFYPSFITRRFLGWKDQHGTDYSAGASISMPAESLTLTAQWTTNTTALGNIGPAGGYVFHDKGVESDGWRYMEAAPLDQASSTWSNITTVDVENTSNALGYGKINSLLAVNQAGHSTSAAKNARDYNRTVGAVNYNDWFLPSLDESNDVCWNLHGKKFSGATITNPDVPSAIGGFLDADYWTSTDGAAGNYATRINFGSGGSNYNFKTVSMSVRSVRAFRDADPLYALAYHPNGGVLNSQDLYFYKAGESVTTKNAGAVTRAGYAFSGWNTASNGLGADYPPETTFAKTAADMLLYAQWWDASTFYTRWVLDDLSYLDSGTNNLHLTAFNSTGIILQTPAGKTGIQFGNVDNLLVQNNPVFRQIAGGQSVSFWFYDNVFTTVGTIISRYRNTDRVWAITSNTTTNGLNVLTSGGYIGGSISQYTAVNSLWNHMVVVFNTGTSQVTVYVNNAVVNTRTINGGLYFDSGEEIRIGRTPGGSGADNALNGAVIRNVRIYNYPLTAGQVDTIYNAELL